MTKNLTTTEQTTEQEQSATLAGEPQFRAIFAASPMGIHSYRLEANDRLIFSGANPAADAILGVDNSQFVGKTIEEAFPPLATTEVPLRYRQACITGEQWHTVQIDYADNLIRGAYEVFAFQTSPGTMAAMFLDVTERKRAEDALQQSEARFRRLVEYAADAFFVHDVNGRIMDVNQQACEALGYSREELLALSVAEIDVGVTPEEVPLLCRKLEPGVPVTIMGRHRRKDGSTFPVEVRLGLLETGEPPLLLALARDISERMRSEEMIRTIAEGVSGETGDSFFRSLTSYLARTLGVEYTFIAEVVGPDLDCSRILALCAGGEMADGFEYDLAGTPCSSVVQEGLVVYPRQVAELFPHDHLLVELGIVSYAGIRLFDASGRVIGLLSLMDRKPMENEETIRSLLRIFGARAAGELERRQAEEQIRRLNADLEQRVRDRTAELAAANQELESFCYSVSHDLRAPLRHINNYSGIILEDFGDELVPQLREYLERIGRASGRMGQLIDDLLQLSRVSRGVMQRVAVDLSAMAREVVVELTEQEPGRTVELNIADDLTAVGDPQLLRLVLQNLLGNAWKFTARLEQACIEFLAVERDGRSCYLVRDNGAGFDMRYADKLFLPFQRLHSEAEFTGTGIGLATVKRILMRHGGRVWAESVLGAGASFYFTLWQQSDGGDVAEPAGFLLP